MSYYPPNPHPSPMNPHNYSHHPSMNLGDQVAPITPINRRVANPTVRGGFQGSSGPHRHSPNTSRFNPHQNNHSNGSHQTTNPGQEGPNLGDYQDHNDFSDLMQSGDLMTGGLGDEPRGGDHDELPPALDLDDIGPNSHNATTTQARNQEEIGRLNAGAHTTPETRANPADLRNTDGNTQNLEPANHMTPDAIRRYMETPDGLASMVGILIQRGGVRPDDTSGPCRHVYGPIIREQVRTEIRNILKQTNIPAYTKTHAANGEMYINGPFALIRAHVLARPAAWRQTHLPIGLATDATDAVENLDRFLRTMVKHERTTLRNLVLIQVRPDARIRAPGPIPRLFDLLVLIHQGLTHRHHHLSREELRRWATRPVQFRFAMLRLLAVHHYLNRPPGQNLSQWNVIDRYLEMLAGLSQVTLQAYVTYSPNQSPWPIKLTHSYLIGTSSSSCAKIPSILMVSST
ncbi:uncharacterized protein PGTG_15635 [Puccinia graminis f. sp. tritici CRL 75-36-700-3]|uniref:Uncharacterized protein n=1 Tax=Puccinia graminis f. sp. tritici (strain CRL 75-36-700-3 / race SCCL) TaxID=418459 RepID=E3KZE7_PUCGT|nr:uncharacterized protein PGTG_15635 [Puccinia graminis f. sp. tritici CRL 75-36-700-3]EFP89672.1 hypothetical protein PGTG_15635 [Puccinia graminis f. sp. tritici CRL 75-36-700-3]